mmetsp:Transcript_17349/g.25717  ORF Transcript_17349/g.25717 Transcript_17349/m.25717 type:complete len:407 (+) Transcript_17349:25-1245(+)
MNSEEGAQLLEGKKGRKSGSMKHGDLNLYAQRKQIEARNTARKLKRATFFVLIFFVVEVVGGMLAGSLAILTDAAHLLTDVSSFILAIVANEIASRPACEKLTYGPVRAEVLSALASTVLILILSVGLVYEAIVRIILIVDDKGTEIDGKLMSIIATIGLIVNIGLFIILGDHAEIGGIGGHDHGHGHTHEEEHSHKGEYNTLSHVEEGHDHDHEHEHDHDHSDHSSSSSEHEHDKVKHKNHSKVRNINLDAAVLHALTDMCQSIGVLIAGLLIWWKPNWKIADPIVTLIFVVLVLNYTRTLLGRALNVLLEGVPEAFSYTGLKSDLLSIEGVSDVHCLHIWSLTLGRTVVTAHLKAENPTYALEKSHELLENLGVVHSTIQIQQDTCSTEDCSHPCVSTVGECCD